ncbi:hypothetical protein RhiirC2_792161 [Rhizophagus irregularis]|uniref:Uncharacterized protein n=1 Tax=Rhizophagus irregularis TaxID=588596 RepID=A0A2N1MHT1_9GLOM|nr:hypothetical protein RhiirC2_792161 [Rhizophagus irregularis]
MFWKTLGACIKRNACVHINFESLSSFESADDLKINSSDDFQETFEQSKWKKQIVLLIDEFDKLYEVDEDFRSSCLETFRGMISSRDNYAMWSIVAIGTFSILYLKSKKVITPFNVSQSYQNPNFTWDQMQFLYNEFVNEFNFTIDLKIIEDIYNQTTRHVKLTGESLEEIVDDKLSFSSWLKFALKLLQKEILGYSTFNKMIDMLKDKNAKPAIDLLQSRFSGVLDFVTIYDDVEDQLAQFLVAKGVLIRNEMTKYAYKMSSSLIDMLIWQRVIPLVYKSSPESAVPKNCDLLDIPNILQMAIQFFNKDIIPSAFDRSYKVADDLYVNVIKFKQPGRSFSYKIIKEGTYPNKSSLVYTLPPNKYRIPDNYVVETTWGRSTNQCTVQ